MIKQLSEPFSCREELAGFYESVGFKKAGRMCMVKKEKP